MTDQFPAKQYEFKDGHWCDVWNPPANDTMPFDDFNGIGESWATAVLTGSLNWCGCVGLDSVMRMFVAYLSGGWGMYEELILHFDDTDPAQSMVAWSSDAAGFTEHGSNVGGSWLTDAGKRWLGLASESTRDR